MSEITITEQESKKNEIKNIEIELENSVTINIEETRLDESKQKRKDTCNSHETCKHEIGPRQEEYKVYNCKDKNTSLNTGFRPHSRETWVYFGIADAAKNQVPPTGGPLDYDPESRNGFVRLVFTLVLMMLLFTCAFNAAVYNIEMLTDIFEDRVWSLFLLICSALVMYIMHYVMFCSECSRSPPCNYICLVIVALAMSVLVACVTIRYKMTVIALAMGITTVICLVCLGLACTSFDFTKYLLYFVVISVALTLVGTLLIILMYVFKWHIKPLHIGILVVFVILNAIGLVMELQMILGGRTVELGEEDYAMGAFMLYTSIIEMFIQILRILNLADADF